MKVSERTALFYLFATMSLWAGNAIVGRMFYAELPPFQLAFWRWVLAGLLVLVVMRPPLKEDWPVIWAHKWILLFIATFGIGCYNTLQYAAPDGYACFGGDFGQSCLSLSYLMASVFWDGAFNVRNCCHHRAR